MSIRKSLIVLHYGSPVAAGMAKCSRAAARLEVVPAAHLGRVEARVVGAGNDAVGLAAIGALNVPARGRLWLGCWAGNKAGVVCTTAWTAQLVHIPAA